MNDQLTILVAASLSFIGTHFALSHPLRAPLVARLGNGGFQGLYTLVALATFAWMAFAFQAVPTDTMPLWNGQATGPWAAATVLMLIASVLLVGSFFGNPAMPAPNAAAMAARHPHGVFLATRHPMTWSFALWSGAHTLVSPAPRVIVLSLAVAVLAVAGSHLQDRKKAESMGAAWRDWSAKTSFGPHLVKLLQAGAVPWLGGSALWLGTTWLHGWLIGMPAGLWRWI